MRRTDTPRRVSVKGRRGIYYWMGADGQRRYEISFTDSAGVRRWKTIAGNLEDAQAALDEVRSRKRKGERVAPSRATLAEVAAEWLSGRHGHLRPRTLERYEVALRVHVLPRLGRLRVSELTEDHVAWLVAEMRDAGAAGWSIRATLTPLSRIMKWCVRQGMAASNPVTKLDDDERPKVSRREMRVLERDELGRLLAAAPDRYRTLLATAVFTGVRLGELLGLRWADVDFEGGLVSVRKQLGRDRVLVEPKTAQAVRDVVLMPALGRMLREHKLSSPRSQPGDFVFVSLRGTPLGQRNVSRRGLDKALERAGLAGDGRPRLRFHDLRHTFASLLVAQGADVVFVSRQLGHANPSITLSVYSHLFDRARHAERTSALLEQSFGTLLETAGGDQGRNEGVLPAGPEGAEVASLQAFGDQRRPVANPAR